MRGDDLEAPPRAAPLGVPTRARRAGAVGTAPRLPLTPPDLPVQNDDIVILSDPSPPTRYDAPHLPRHLLCAALFLRAAVLQEPADARQGAGGRVFQRAV